MMIYLNVCTVNGRNCMTSTALMYVWREQKGL
jgi:hypothetical protein